MFMLSKLHNGIAEEKGLNLDVLNIRSVISALEML